MMDLFIDGKVGLLEARYSEAASVTGVTAVLCHPHPQFGGTMNDLVLGALEPALLASGISSLRFNFRGVGGSEGRYNDGEGEIDDVVAATTWVRERSVGERIMLVGYSFGGAVALSAQERVAPDSMILVAPAVGMFGQQRPPTAPTLVILAENDQFVNADSTKGWFGDPNTRVEQMLDTDHFFIGHHEQITNIVREFLVTTLIGSTPGL
ncbi:MAG: alpha/beta fold hydrolase [Gammaproteobacteria bacterium]|nr:alpha/beta fold hydrolase [Gammaproteobacteria bacterium]